MSLENRQVQKPGLYQNKWQIYNGKILSNTNDTFTAKYNTGNETDPLSSLKYLLTPKLGDCIARTLFGKLVIGKLTENPIANRTFSKLRFSNVYYGTPETLGWSSGDFAAFYRYQSRQVGEPINTFFVILENDALSQYCNSDQNIEEYNINILTQSTDSFPVHLFSYLRSLSKATLQLPILNDAAAVVPRLQSVYASYLATPAFQQEALNDNNNDEDNEGDNDETTYYCNLILRNVKMSTGLHTMLEHIPKPQARRTFTPLYNACKVTFFANNSANAEFNSVSKFRNSLIVQNLKTKEAQKTIEELGLVGKLIRSKLLQGLELTTLTSFLGSRVHQMLMLRASTVANANNEANAPKPAFLNTEAIDPSMFQTIMKPGTMFDAQVEIISNIGSLDSVVESMFKAVLAAFTTYNMKVVACEVPVFTTFRTFSHGKTTKTQRAMESRIDFIGIHNGETVLGDYKTHWGNNNQYSILDTTKHIQQVVIYAFLLLQNYSILVDSVAIVYVNRNSDVTICKVPFKEPVQKIGLRQRERPSAAKQVLATILKEFMEIPGFTVDSNIVAPTSAEINVDSLLTEKAFFKYWYYGGDSALAIPTATQFKERVQQDPFFERILNRKTRFQGTDPLFLLYKNVYSWYNTNAVAAAAAAPFIGTSRFFHPELIHPNIGSRRYGTFINNRDGRRIREPLDKVEQRKQFNTDVYQNGVALSVIRNSTNNLYSSETLHDIFQDLILSKNKPPRMELEAFRIQVCVRALQVQINTLLLEQCIEQKLISSEDVPFNLPVTSVPQYPLALNRFELFKHLSQRPAWHQAMYDYGQEILPKAVEMLQVLLSDYEED